MTYASLGELPPQVRAALDPEDQEVWLRAFNDAVIATENPREAFRTAWHTAAQGENVRRISGIVNRDVVDGAGERLNQEALVHAINEAIWLGGATYNDIHSNHPFGDWFDAEVELGEDGIKQTRVYGVVRKGKPFYDECWNRYILGGDKSELSIAIMKIDPYVKCEGGRCWKQVDGSQVFEASAVPKGLCPGSRLDSINFSAKSYSDAAPARAGDKEMTEAQQEKDPAAPPQTADKEEPKGEPDTAKAPETGSTGALEEGMQKLMGMMAEQNARMDRLEASVTALKPPAPVEKEAPPATEEKPAEETPVPEKEEVSEEKEDAPPEEKKPEQEPGDKGEKCGCPKKQMSNKAAELVAANKEARKEAEAHGASAQRPEMVLDGNAAKTQHVKAESAEERMRRYAGMSAAELEAEGQKLAAAVSRTV